jgi:Protein of unknown function (DUF2892)
MTCINEGDADRVVRIFAGVLLLAAGWALASGTPAVIAIAVGAIALGTGIVGWCPAYTVFGFSTRKIPAGHCPNCEAEDRR